MNSKEKTEYHNKATEYLKERGVRDIMQEALKELLIVQPADPQAWLIDYFSTRKKFHIYSVIGYPEEKRTKMIEDMVSEHNLKVINVPLSVGKLAGDTEDYSKLLSFRQYSVNFDGVVLNNFPLTHVRAVDCRHRGML